jgi:poly(3-hydroxybutyrate) depolymerase
MMACGPSRAPGFANPGAAGSTPGGDAGSDAVVITTVDGGKPSSGCGAVPDQLVERFVQHMEVVPNLPATYAATYTNRVYWVRLPANYDTMRAYPTVFIGPGCGETGDTGIPIQMATKDDAIIVGLNGVDNCFNKDAADTPELPYFDQTLATIEANYCVDTAHVFMAGFSSGSWLTSYLGCARGNVIRAQASVAGGLPPVPACTGPIPAMYVSDTDDDHNPTATVMIALSRVLTANGCGAETEPYDFGVPSSPWCVQYKGCMPGYPVVWCVTSGVGHANQATTMISTVGFWHFWTSLP